MGFNASCACDWCLQIPEKEVQELIQHLDGASRGVIDYNGEPYESSITTDT